MIGFDIVLIITVFISVLSDSAPGIGLIVPEEVVLTTSVILSEGVVMYLLIAFASISAMMLGQTIIFLLARRYRYRVTKLLRLNDLRLKKIESFVDSASFSDHVLLRISTTSIFRILAAFASGLQGMEFRRHLMYELSASVLKTSVYISIGFALRGNVPDDEVEQIVLRVGIAILVITFISLLITYYIKRKL